MQPSEVIPGILEYYKGSIRDERPDIIQFDPKFSEEDGIWSGDLDTIAYLLSKETGRPFIFSFMKEPLVSMRIFHIPETISLSSNSLQLFVLLNKVLQKKYNIRPKFDPFTVSSLRFDISISRTLIRNTENIANLITFLGRIFKHRVKIKIEKLRCKFCGLRSSFVDVPICLACLSMVRKENLVKYSQTLDPQYLFKGRRNLLRRDSRHTAKILLGLKKMPRRKRRYEECIECGKGLSIYIPSVFNQNICSLCETKFDWKFFQVEYENGRVTWKDFEKDPKVRERYKLDYFR